MRLPAGRLRLAVASSFVPSFFAGAPRFAAEARTVLIIRHGEKPAVGNDLSAVGQARAECIKGVFGQGPLRPSYIFAQEPDLQPDGYHEIRSLQTCQPLADHLGLPPVSANTGPLASLSRNVDISIDRDHAPKLAAAVANVSPTNATVLICWEHDAISQVAKSLGVSSVPLWPDSDFDSVWVVDTATNSMAVQPQGCGSGSSAGSSVASPVPVFLGTALLAVVWPLLTG